MDQRICNIRGLNIYELVWCKVTGSKHVQDIYNILKVIGSDKTEINGHIKTAFLVTWKQTKLT